MQFNGFGFSGYRSIGDELVKIAPLKKINLIIGQNNSGKSNIITYLKNYLSPLHKGIQGRTNSNIPPNEIDRHISNKPVKARIAFPFLPEEKELDLYLQLKLPNPAQDYQNQLSKQLLRRMLTSKPMLSDDGFVWFVYESPTLHGKYETSIPDSIKGFFSGDEWRNLWLKFMNVTSGGTLEKNWIPETINELPFLPSHIPPIEFIPAIRKIGEPGTEADDYSGLGIIKRLAQIESPTLGEQALRKDFDDINQFLRTVLENGEATIQIPHDRQSILVYMDGKTLPLSSLGTGIHEVIIIAAAATLLKDSILCIEEPELHLHPLLQRKLVRYLSENTSNQYIFTTHSAHLLEIDVAEVFHVKHANGATTVEAITTTKDKSNICHDLGYKASDLLQANCVIWVEGPSDRIYINYWLRSIDDTLIEGVHYSIMFYGGRLFSHLSAEDEEDYGDDLQDFISLRKLNRNTCVVFDSDKSSPRKHLTGTKKRLKVEFNKGPGFAWVTEGREIENYIDPKVVEKCIRVVHPSAKAFIEKGKWSNLLKYYKKKTLEEKVANKVKIARYYVQNYEPDLDVFDLKKNMHKLRQFIDESNGTVRENL